VLSPLLNDGDVVLTLGAGSIGKSAVDLAKDYAAEVNHD